MAELTLTEGQREDITKFVAFEIDDAQNRRWSREQRWRDIIDAYELTPEEEDPTFPWVGCSNIVAPLIASAVDGIFARLIIAIHSIEPFWTIQARQNAGEEMRSYAKPLENFLEAERKGTLNTHHIFSNWILEATKLGMSTVKVVHVDDKRLVRFVDREGVAQEREYVKSAPYILNTAADDMLFSAGDRQINGPMRLEWVASRTRYNLYELDQKEKDGIFENVEKIKVGTLSSEGEDKSLADFYDDIEGLDQILQPWRKRDVWEMWLDYPINGNVESLLIHFEESTRTILKIQPNMTNAFGDRMFLAFRYFRRENRLDGIGVGDMLYSHQEEITRMKRQREDNATLANTINFKGREDVIKPGDETYPGKAWIVEDVKTDLESFNLGQIYPHSIANEQIAQADADKRVGVSDYFHGNESEAVGSRATASATLALMGESGKRMDVSIGELRQSAGELGQMIIEAYAYKYPEGRALEILPEEEAAKVEEFFALEYDTFRKNFSIDLTATEAIINKELEKQTHVALMEILNNYYDKVIQMKVAISSGQVPPEVAESMTRAIEAGTELLRRLLGSFNIKDPETFLVETSDESGDEDDVPNIQGVGQNPGQAGAAIPGAPGPGVGVGQLGGIPEGEVP